MADEETQNPPDDEATPPPDGGEDAPTSEADPDQPAEGEPAEGEQAEGEQADSDQAEEPAEVEQAEEPEPEPVVAQEHEAMLERLRAGLDDGDIVAAESNHGDLIVRVTNEAWHRVGEVARQRLDCEYLSFISGIDWMSRPTPPTEDPDAPSGPAQPQEVTYGATGSEGRFQVFACVESTDDKIQILFKTDVDEADPVVASWTDLYPGADWHERECWEMYGFRFEGHPHLRHLYLPGEFEGHPLRKDYPLLSREVKPWPGLVDVELMPEAGEETSQESDAAATSEGGQE